MSKVHVYLMASIFLALFLCQTMSPAVAEDGPGKALYEEKCASCHGTNGDGQGPLASMFNPAPVDFSNPGFWQGNFNQKIADTVNNGHGPMPAINLSPSQIKAVIDYMSHTFK
jgi:mono/diheme cytochrome c family protein